MLPDPLERELGDALRRGLPGLASDWEQRALSAVAGVRPRRHPHLVPLLIGLLLLLLAAAILYATMHRHFVQGTLQWREGRGEATVSRPSWSNSATRYLSGDREWQTASTGTETVAVSPVTHRQLFTSSPDGGTWPPRALDVIASNPDRSGRANLTAHLGGVNCHPRWSPDGTLVAFVHRDPAASGPPCRTSPQVWLVAADGAKAHRVNASGGDGTTDPAWSPDGARLLLWAYDEWPQAGVPRGHAVTIDLKGEQARALPNVGRQALYSPDGTQIVSLRVTAATLQGAPGVWSRLLLTDADGNHPKVVVEQFVSDADVAAHRRRLSDDPRLREDALRTWPELVRAGVAPQQPVWSPRGDKIAFLVASPFDPRGTWYSDQLEVWVYDLLREETVRLTYDDVSHTELQWK